MINIFLIFLAGFLAHRYFGTKGAIILFLVGILISVLMYCYEIKFTFKLESKKLGFETHLTIGHSDDK